MTAPTGIEWATYDDREPDPWLDQRDPTEDDQVETELQFNRDVSDELQRLRVRDRARQLLQAENTPAGVGGLTLDGAAFVLDQPADAVPIWGNGRAVAWAQGEPLMLCGTPGVGKTTIAAQIVRARIGLGPRDVLGFTVQPTASRVLYLAMDRPSQISRAMARIFTDDERDTLAERLQVHKGPPPADLALEPHTLVKLAHAAGADTVIVDSLKDGFLGIAEDGPAAAYNRARQTAIAAGIELLELHHLRKNGANGGKPGELSDIYGSAWITAGAGSVIVLIGDAGDPLIELRHLKQPADTIGPLRILHDNTTGRTIVHHSADLYAVAKARGNITAKDAACAMFEKDKPTSNETEKARRRLGALVASGHLTVSQDGDQATSTPTKWAPADLLQTFTAPLTAPKNADPITTPSRTTRPPRETNESDPHANLHDLHAQGPSRTHPPLEGGEGESHPGRSNCTTCQQPMHPDLAAAGETTHPTCDQQETP